jgi:hypothetical protein
MQARNRGKHRSSIPEKKQVTQREYVRQQCSAVVTSNSHYKKGDKTMKKLLTLVFALVALGVLTTFGLAQERESRRVPETLLQEAQSRIPTLTCCECLGKVTTLNLSTGQGSPVDPIWKVNNGPAYTTPPFPGWILPSNPVLTPAKWIQPVPSPTPSHNIGPGIFKYTVRFNTPKCVIPNRVTLDVYFAADNGAKVFLDGTQVPTSPCSGTCFKAPQAPVHFTAAVSALPTHTLEIELKNDTPPASGLIVNAKVTRQCARGTPGAQEDVIEP